MQMTLFERTYEILKVCKEGETSVSGEVILERAAEMRADIGDKEGIYVLLNWHEIPRELEYKVVFLFPDWRNPNDPDSILYIYTDGHQWHLRSFRLNNNWGDDIRLIRRVH